MQRVSGTRPSASRLEPFGKTCLNAAPGMWNGAPGCVSETPGSHLLITSGTFASVCTRSVVIANGNYQPFPRTRRLV